MKSRKLQFANGRGEQLAALLDLPDDEQPLAYALFAHCFTCGKHSKVGVYVSRALCRERIAVLRFDFTGLGESEGVFADSNFSSNIRDLVAAAGYLEQQYAAPSILIGHSFGGAAVLWAAAQIASVKAVATLAAPYDPAHLLRHLGSQRQAIEANGAAQVDLGEKQVLLKRQLLEDLSAQHPTEVIGGLNKPLLVLHAPTDQTVGIDNAAKIYQAARHPKSFVSLDRADHLLTDERDAGYAGRMIATWVTRYLETGQRAGFADEVIDNRVTVRTAAQGFYTEMFAGGHALVADEPRSYGGTGLGPSPYDYLLAALGSCTGMTVAMYARRKGWPLRQVLVRLRHNKIHADDCRDCDSNGGKIDHFERELELQGELSEDQRQRLLEIAEKCPVHKTLHAEVRVQTKLRDQERDMK